MLNLDLAVLQSDLVNAPSPELLVKAQQLCDRYPDADLPDWVHALANGNPDRWQAVIEVAQADLRFEESQKGNHD